MRAGQGVEGLEDGVEGGWAFGAVEQERPFALFDGFGVALLENACGARVAGFAVGMSQMDFWKGSRISCCCCSIGAVDLHLAQHLWPAAVMYPYDLGGARFHPAGIDLTSSILISLSIT